MPESAQLTQDTLEIVPPKMQRLGPDASEPRDAIPEGQRGALVRERPCPTLHPPLPFLSLPGLQPRLTDLQGRRSHEKSLSPTSLLYKWTNPGNPEGGVRHQKPLSRSVSEPEPEAPHPHAQPPTQHQAKCIQ